MDKNGRSSSISGHLRLGGEKHGVRTDIQKTEVEQDVFLFHHWPFCNYLTSLINSVSTVINEDIKLPLEGIKRNIQIHDKQREKHPEWKTRLNPCQRIRNERKT